MFLSFDELKQKVNINIPFTLYYGLITSIPQNGKSYQQIDQFRYIQIQLETIDLSTKLWGINTEFVGFIPQSLVLRSIVSS